MKGPSWDNVYKIYHSKKKKVLRIHRKEICLKNTS